MTSNIKKGKERGQKFNHFFELDFFAPYVFFPFILICYFVAGYLFDFGRSNLFYLKENILPLVIVAFLAYVLAVYVTNKLNWKIPYVNIPILSNHILWVFYLLGIIGLISFLIMIFTGQIGLSDESVRRNLDPKLTFLSGFLWFAVLIIVYLKIIYGNLSKRTMFFYIGILLLVFVMFILTGYRTPLVVMFLTSFVAYHYLVKRIHIKWVLTIFVTLSICLSLFGYMRTVTEDKSLEFNKEEEVNLNKEEIEYVREVKRTPKFLLASTAEFVNGRIVLSRLIEYSKEHGYMNGKLHAGIFSTVLPGEQLSPRMHITNMVNELSVTNDVPVTREGRTTIPTLVGQFFIDGGYALLIIGFAFYGIILTMLYNRIKEVGFRSYAAIVYSFVTTIAVLSIHTGLLDLLFIIMIGILIFCLMIYKPKLKI
jgi:hypothetical protein